MANCPLIIVGSARKQSDTKRCLDLLFQEQEHTIIDLLDFNIEPYQYVQSYAVNDNFLAIINQIFQHQVVIFATPVYWYAMSGRLKTFFDRFTDLVTIRKDLGRGLKDRKVFLVAVGADDELPPGFIVPFELTASYLQMHFVDYFYICTKNITAFNHQAAIPAAFLENIRKHC